jgi:hypothetical protein
MKIMAADVKGNIYFKALIKPEYLGRYIRIK